MSGIGTREFAALKEAMRERMRPERFAHVLGVVDSAAALARRWDADVEKAMVAGILHDCARDLPRKFLLEKALDFGIIGDEIIRWEPVLLHAPVGAALASREFGIADEDILNAIRYHTTGRAGMSPLEQVVFVADYIEPGRSHAGVERVRDLAEKDLAVALRVALEQTMRHLLDGGRLIHPDTLAARNHLVQP